jgi:hypothetical protein
MLLIAVVLPEPFEPSSPNTSPRMSENDIFLTPRPFLYSFFNSLISRTGVPAMLAGGLVMYKGI